MSAGLVVTDPERPYGGGSVAQCDYRAAARHRSKGKECWAVHRGPTCKYLRTSGFGDSRDGFSNENDDPTMQVTPTVSGF